MISETYNIAVKENRGGGCASKWQTGIESTMSVRSLQRLLSKINSGDVSLGSTYLKSYRLGIPKPALFCGVGANLTRLMISCNQFDVCCRCPESHVGQFCQHVNPCYTGSRTTRRCLNGGRCNVEFPGNSFISRTTNPRFRCDCRIGFSASLCEIPLPNVCDRTPCQNGGTCNLLSLTNYTCNCREGYRGVVCDQVRLPVVQYLSVMRSS